jgi:hypothetical protein
MADNNLDLHLDAGTDYYNIGKFNENFQKLKTFMTSLSSEQIAYFNSAMEGVQNVGQALDHLHYVSENKVNTAIPLEENTDLDDLAEGLYFCPSTLVAGTLINAPVGISAFTLRVAKSWNTNSDQGYVQIASSYGFLGVIGTQTCQRASSIDGSTKRYTPWVRLATAAPPQEYDLSLITGFISRVGSQCSFSRNDFGMVTLLIGIQANPIENRIGGSTHIATLPEGYRPASTVRSSCTGHTADGTQSVAGIIEIFTDGKVMVSYVSGQYATAFGYVSFSTAQ